MEPVSSYLLPTAVSAIVGAGMVTGLLFAFSNFVMKALADMPSAQGMFAMQRINERILNPIFFVLFFGTPVACVVLVVLAMGSAPSAGRSWLMLGAVLYIVGPFGITIARNVPLNNKLASIRPHETDAFWPRYQRVWQFWNHVRSYVGASSVACMAIGTARLAL